MDTIDAIKKEEKPTTKEDPNAPTSIGVKHSTKVRYENLKKVLDSKNMDILLNRVADMVENMIRALQIFDKQLSEGSLNLPAQSAQEFIGSIGNVSPGNNTVYENYEKKVKEEGKEEYGKEKTQ